jgi:hypothetical protein
MSCIEKTACSVQSGFGQFVRDCSELKNYSHMKKGEFQRRITSLTLRVLASLIVAVGSSIFIAGSIAIIVHADLAAIAAVINLVKLGISTLIAPFIVIAGAVAHIAESTLCKTCSIGGLGLITYIPTAFAYRMTIKLQKN